MNRYQTLLDEIQNLPAQPVTERQALLSPAPLAHSQQIEAQLPRLRQHVGPRAWYAWLEKAVPVQN